MATNGAMQAIAEAGQEGGFFLTKHVNGDWGEISQESQNDNDHAVEHGERVHSVYRTLKGVEIWIITEADRSATTFLLPSEY